MENIYLFSVRQALADISHFITELQRLQLIPKNSKIITSGCSYAGTLAAWSRILYPNQIHGAISRSAPLQVKFELNEFGTHASKAINEITPMCMNQLKIALYLRTRYWCPYHRFQCQGKYSMTNYRYQLAATFHFYVERVERYHVGKIKQICKLFMDNVMGKCA